MQENHDSQLGVLEQLNQDLGPPDHAMSLNDMAGFISIEVYWTSIISALNAFLSIPTSLRGASSPANVHGLCMQAVRKGYCRTATPESLTKSLHLGHGRLHP